MASDSLVLKIEEVFTREDNTEQIDNTVFIFFDRIENCYFLRGKRNNTSRVKFNTYNFKCDDIDEVVNFLSFIIDNYNLLNYTLYNIKELPCSSDEINFNFLVNNSRYKYEIVGYDSEVFSNEILRNRLKLVKTVYNEY